MALNTLLERKLDTLTQPLTLQLPNGQRVGRSEAAVTLRLHDTGVLAHIAAGAVGKVAQDYVEGRMDVEGNLRDLMGVASEIVAQDPTRSSTAALPWHWWHEMRHHLRSRAHHNAQADTQQVQFHYDVSDDFFALWLDPRRVYSCAYFPEPAMSLARAQEAKLDLICRKLLLQPGQRLLDIGAGWGALLVWAAQHYGVQAHGITLSLHQHAHVQRLIAHHGLLGRVSVALCDYRELSEAEPFDRIASVGMFEHVGRAQLPAYFAKMSRLLKPGGLLLNHGITAGGTRNHQLGAGMGDFVERYIFPGGELLHVSKVLEVMSDAGLEPLDAENLRPHYARTLWAWSDALEARLAQARTFTSERVLRAYRMYLAGSAMGFEKGWLSLFQVLAAKPGAPKAEQAMPGAQSAYPFQRAYMYAP